nr:MAG TPA: hypothetical protein [Caudoviricetes sp.]
MAYISVDIQQKQDNILNKHYLIIGGAFFVR